MGERLSTARAKSERRFGKRRYRQRARPRISVEFAVPKPSAQTGQGSSRLQFQWADAIAQPEWNVYKRAIQAVRKADIPFLLGGGFALATFTGRWRDTKDIDFYVMPQARSAAVSALKQAGFSDYYKTKPYDRGWIYRSVRSDVIVDIIWSMANRRAKVDQLWFKHAEKVSIRGEELKVIPMEEFIWCKLYILQRDHCDWTDILNLIYFSGRLVDWKRLIERLNQDTSLLKAVLTVFAWLCPGRAAQLPLRIWKTLRMSKPSNGQLPVMKKRIRYLDSRAWFAGRLRTNSKLQV
jgi:hypothetical protein